MDTTTLHPSPVASSIRVTAGVPLQCSFALPCPGVFPVLNSGVSTFSDSLTTMAVMGLDDLLTETIDFASKIDFSVSHTDSTVSVFETTIRYLAGLISAYELTGSKHQVLIDRAHDVAAKMAVAWVGDNAMPYGFLDFSTNKPTVANVRYCLAYALR